MNITSLSRNVPVFRGLRLDLFRVSGCMHVKTIVVVAHGLAVEERSLFARTSEFALELSDKASPLTPLAYPVATLFGAIVENETLFLSLFL